MLVLPGALSNYQLDKDAGPIDPQTFAVADAVRMSMSIPYFFQPVELIHVETGLPSTIVDGGCCRTSRCGSSTWKTVTRKRPTFGFKLIGGKGVGGGLEKIVHAFGWPVQMGVNIFHTATDAWDKHWVSSSTYVRTCTVSAGDIGTTDFDLTQAQRQWLLESGKEAARKFLDEWQPSQYVNSYGRTL